jgi:hypothetical protein
MGEMRKGYKILVRKPKEKKSSRRHRCRWEDYIRDDLRATKREIPPVVTGE